VTGHQSTATAGAHRSDEQPPLVTLLTDYGLGDEFVGVLHGVIAGICPQARVIDITHGIERHDVRKGALVLRAALAYCPRGVHVAVVDPGVGTARRGVAVRAADGRILVGPDNGLLSLALESAGGAVEAVEITRSPLRLEPVSATFHGRDIFAPVAAHLAAGTPAAEAGEPFDPDTLVRLDLPAPKLDGATIHAHVLTFDRFGNAILSASHEHATAVGLKLGRPVLVSTPRGERETLFVRTFGDVAPGELLLYEDSWRMLALAVNRGDVRSVLGIAVDDKVTIAPVREAPGAQL
jgi:S-adenosylmethionine hydrolase